MADRFDLDAIDADDALLDLLAAGGETARTAGEHDPAVGLLAELRLAVEVEDQLPVETIDDPESFLARCAALNPITDPFARKIATRGLALGVAAVAALSVSGVAAAVNGDPLSPYEKVIEKMVDAVRPQTSFPKEQLDGMSVVDKAKIVKVGKNFKQVQQQKAVQEEQQAQQAQDKPDGLPPSLVVSKNSPDVLQKALVPQTATVTTLPPEQPAEPQKTDDNKPTDGATQPPAAAPTDNPTTAPTTAPTQPTDTTTPPSTAPTEPVDTAPPTTTPTDPPSTPVNGETGTGDTGTGTGDPGSTTTTPPTDTGEAPGSGTDSGDGKDNSGVPGSDGTATPPAADPTGTDQTGGDQSGKDEQQPSDGTSQDAPASGALPGLVAGLLEPILPTPTGAPVELESAQQFFGKGAEAVGKHGTAKVSTGSVKKVYPKGKHSSGLYAEGKHAAIARTHGSTEDADVLKILGVVNKPIK
ncbi:hypothetical protein [Kribbella sp. NPDC055071]